MINSGSKIIYGGLPFSVANCWGSFVELELEDRQDISDDYSKKRIYIHIDELMQYNTLQMQTDMIRYMFTDDRDDETDLRLPT